MKKYVCSTKMIFVAQSDHSHGAVRSRTRINQRVRDASTRRHARSSAFARAFTHASTPARGTLALSQSFWARQTVEPGRFPAPKLSNLYHTPSKAGESCGYNRWGWSGKAHALNLNAKPERFRCKPCKREIIHPERS